MIRFNNLSGTFKKYKIKYVIICLLILVSVVVCLFCFVVPYIKQTFDGYSTSAAISSIAVIVSVLALLFKVLKVYLNHQLKGKKSINLEVLVENDTVVLECMIENNGLKRIEPQNVYLFVESGELSKRKYVFPFLLKHEKGECDCVLSKRCQGGGLNHYPEDLVEKSQKNVYRTMVKYEHLSCDSILYIDPGESFCDSVVLKLPEGVYRATVVATIVKDDCICTLKNFVVK